MGRRAFVLLSVGLIASLVRHEASARPVSLLMTAHPIAAGLQQAFAIHDGVIQGWGFDWDGRLGTGLPHTYNRLAPAGVSGFSKSTVAAAGRIKAISTGYTHTLALTESGEVYAWGLNTYGQLGDGTNVSPDVLQTPRKVAGVTDVVQVVVGNWHSLAVTSTGKLYAWGRNLEGQLGLGHTNPVYSPTLVPISNVRSIAAGWYHSIVIDSARAGFAMGQNMYGQLGIGVVNGTKSSPTAVKLSSLAQASGGRDFTLFRDTAGRVWGAGRDLDGQLGDSAAWSDSDVPVMTTGLAGIKIVDIAAGEKHSLALSDAGKVYVWGDDGSGALGLASTDDKFVPVVNPSLERVVAIAAGTNFGMAADMNGKLTGWGPNFAGQLGDGTTTAADQPAKSVYAFTYKVLAMSLVSAPSGIDGYREIMTRLAADIKRISYGNTILEVDYFGPVVATPAQIGCKGTSGDEDTKAVQNYLYASAAAAGISLGRYGHVIINRSDDLDFGCTTTSNNGGNVSITAGGRTFDGMGQTYLSPFSPMFGNYSRNVVAHEFLHGFSFSPKGGGLGHIGARDCKASSGAAFVPGAACDMWSHRETYYASLLNGMNFMSGSPSLVPDVPPSGAMNESMPNKDSLGWLGLASSVSYALPTFRPGTATTLAGSVVLMAGDADTITAPGSPYFIKVPVQGSTRGEFYGFEYRPQAVTRLSDGTTFGRHAGVYLSVNVAGSQSLETNYLRSAAKDAPDMVSGDTALAAEPLPVGQPFVVQDGFAVKVTNLTDTSAKIDFYVKP